MAKNQNLVVLMGNLTRDPEYRTFPNGGGVCNLSIAVNSSVKNKVTGAWEDEPTFIELTAWDRGDYKMGQMISEGFRKGSRILINGSLKMESWDDKTSGQKRTKLKVVVSDFFYLEKKGEGHQAPREQQSSGGYSESYQDPDDSGPGSSVGDEIPF